MSRLQDLCRDQLDPAGQDAFDRFVGARAVDVITPDLITESGALRGPFNAFMRAPDLGRRLASLGAALRSDTSIERRLTEVAVITVSSRWKTEFEWWSHALMARQHGVSGPVIDAIGAGEDPPIEAEDERIVYAVASDLVRTGQVSQDHYEAANSLLGETGMVELVSLCGYYTLISYLLNAFVVPPPPGATPQWPDVAR
jgi:4-carboxymuconolactone decarboxylase